MSGTGLRPIVLGSSSRYRKELLERLSVPFQVIAPDVDESPADQEQPRALAVRLARAKAWAVANLRPGSVVIGSDQVADLSGQALGKPGDHGRATAQLRAMRGKTVLFHTALCVVCVESCFEVADVAEVRVRFRNLTDEEIEHYLRAEQPYDCAGSARSEGLGISLLDAIDSDDPTALIGLPLIRTCRMLRSAGAMA